MIYNLLAFTVIFTIFGIIIFTQVQNTLFREADNELTRFKEMITDNSFMEFDASPPNNAPERNRLDDRPIDHANPRIMIIDWNANGEIINKNEIGTLFYENYLQDYPLNTTTVGTITNTTINDEYYFRYILLKETDETNDVAYTQIMINVDAEQTILTNFGQLIFVCSTVFILLSITASYMLSKKMMDPIIRSWNKQTEFVENASHELRTPLTIIQNKLELLLRTPQEKIANKFENIALSLSETRRLSKMTSDLLTLTRADSAETTIVKDEIQIDIFVEKICNPYMEIAASQGKQFWLNLNSKLTIYADESRLHQLLVILIDNALKYTTEKDSIGLKTYEQDNKLVIEVSDTGIGIKEDNIKHIFDRFYREDKARSRDTGGTGLGLSIAQWIVEKHNGTIKVIPNESKGTTFKVKLPK